MENLSNVWSALSVQRRFFVGLATVAVFAAVLMLARNVGNQNMSLLFGGLEAGAAADVITSLDQQGVPYEVRGNAIYVPAPQRDALRMGLAGEGLPANGSRGYELLDSLSGFSTTAQMFDAAYWRAKEGELARTILASPHIRASRVHISTPGQRPFQRDQKQTAAVTVTTAGGALANTHVKALQFLVAAAVPGLAPEEVAIIDDNGRLLSDADAEGSLPSQDERADELRLRAERLLAARVGPGNAVVEVTVDIVNETESITERRVDPDSRIAISTDVTETSGTSTDSRNGAVTVASNLPDGEAGNSSGASSNENSESRTLTNYEVSETERQLVRAPGAIKRLTVAVLVNEVSEVGPDGTRTTAPRTEEEIASLEELVASAVGLDRARGDVLTLRAMPFEPIMPMGTEALDGGGALPLDIMQLIQIAALAFVALILGLFVVRPILVQSAAAGSPLSIENVPDPIDISPIPTALDGEAIPGVASSDQASGNADNDPVARLRKMIADREPESLQLLQDWVENPKADAS